MREQFFSPKGLTSTSANHIANLAKEFIQTQRTYIARLSFVGENTHAGGNTYITSCATPQEEFDNLTITLNKISQATQLIAWLREGIKEKQNAQVAIPAFETWLSNQGIECFAPEKPKYLTEADIIKSWDENKYNAFITAQTYASVYGEIIHPQGEYSCARKELTKAIAKPNSVSGQGRDLTVTTLVPAYTIDEVDAKFFELQKIQREHQAKYNQYQHEITNALDIDKATKDSEYSKLYEEYRKTSTQLQNEYTIWKNSEAKRLADLKIVIPDALVDIYNEIQGLGK